MIRVLKQLFNTQNNNEMIDIIKNGYLIDVRSPMEFMGGNVPGSVNIPLDKLPQRLNDLRQKKDIVVFCQSGARAGVAKKLLEENGFTHVTNGGGWASVKKIIEN